MNDAGSKAVPTRAGYTRHEFTISSDLSQKFMLEVNMDDLRITTANCTATPMNVHQVLTYIELTAPGATVSVNSSFSMLGALSFNNGIPYTITAGQSYKLALELYGTNVYVPKDFSVVTWG